MIERGEARRRARSRARSRAWSRRLGALEGLGGAAAALASRAGSTPGEASWPPAPLGGCLLREEVRQPEHEAVARHLHKGVARADRLEPGQREHLDFIRGLNTNPLEIELRNRELAFRMQSVAPGIMDLNQESEATRKSYGIGEDHTDEFGQTLLLARRFAESGVRYITATHSTSRYGNLWDQHANLEKGHRGNAHAVDQPIAALLSDLEARGLLDDTLVLCGSEFGRTPSRELFDGQMGRSDNGRDHNPHGFTMWMAGGGTKPGYHHGATDDYGFYAAENKVSIHDLHATILHLMGIDHERLTYHHSGRDYRLTDVFGSVVEELLA